MAIVKRIRDNSGSGKEFESVTTSEVTYDTTPQLGSFNPVVSDGIFKAISGASGEVPAVNPGDAGKVLTAGFDGDTPTVSWAEPTVDQTYDAESTNAQSGVAVASAIGSVNAVPASTSVDEGKVLTVDNAGSAAWATPAVPTVDQTYDATSANAQSGVAVAEAVGGVLPSLTGNAGKVLAVNSGATGTEWVAPAAPGGGSDEWWGGEPGIITLPEQTLRLKFKDLSYDPRNETDTSFTDHFQSITKVEDGVYDFLFANNNSGQPKYASAFYEKYLSSNEFIIVAFNLATVDASTYKDCQSMFYGATGLRAAYNVTLGNYLSRTNNMLSYMFKNCSNLKYFSWSAQTIGAVSSFEGMFEGCSSLIDCNMQILKNDGNGYYDCRYICKGCTSLITGPQLLYGCNNSTQAFSGCTSLTGFHNRSYVINAAYFTKQCTSTGMFSDCRSLETADIAFFAMNVIESANNLFQNCTSLRTPPRHIKLAASSTTLSMFEGCLCLRTIPEMDYGSITSITSMFRNCEMLPDISALATVTWNASLPKVDYMFLNCFSIEKGLKDVYDNMAATATITGHSNTFTGCGEAFSNPDLAQIPSSWGGTGA